jgi:hypothetical protein
MKCIKVQILFESREIMKFKSLFIALIAALSLSTVVVAQEELDSFGNCKFGSNKEAVKAEEKANTLVMETEDELMFNETSDFMGTSQNCYTFSKDGKLETVTLNIVNNHEDLANYIADYNKMNEMFTQMYGEPTSSGFSTEDKELLSDPAKLAQAIKEGKVAASTEWKLKTFTLSHVLSEQMTTDDMTDEVKKATIITPICHLAIATIGTEEDDEEAAGAEK